MKLKYYLRGIGIGIIVAVAICISAGLRNGNTGKAMTDEEIKLRAAELGMTEEKVLSDMAAPTAEVTETVHEPENTEEISEPEIIDLTGSDEAATEEIKEDETEAEEPEPTPEPTKEPEPTPEPTKEPEPTPEPTKEPVKEAVSETADSADYVTITIERGNGSDTVAKKLAAAGLISDASSYDKWLMQNGYDRVIAAGTHKIPKGAGNEEIAKIICKRK